MLERAVGTHNYTVQLLLCPLTSTYSVVYLFPQAYFNTQFLMLCCGAGFFMPFCALQRSGKAPASRICEYYETSLGEEQKPWLKLIKNGCFGDVSPSAEPVSYVKAKDFRPLLENASRKPGGGRWYALLQLGVHYYIYGENDNARDAWLESVSECESAWGYRNLAVLYKNEYGDAAKAIEYIGKAAALGGSCRAILVDCARLYTDNGLDREWLELFENLSEELKNVGRLRLFKAIALINLGRLEEARGIVNKDFVMYDIQEGEVSISHIWKRLYKEIIKTMKRDFLRILIPMRAGSLRI